MKNTTREVTYCVRLALLSDVPALQVVDPLMQVDRDRQHLVRSSVDRAECLVAGAEDDGVQGFAILNYTFFSHAFVPLLVVAAGARRRGLATALLAEAERQCVRNKLFVSCNRSNVHAQYLFERCGFVPSGQVENLDDEDDELVVFKSLPGKN